MSTLADPGTDPQTPESLWQERIKDAENYRYRFEPTWLSNLAFVAGRHWDVYDRFDRTLRHISDVDPRYANRELYSADIIHENRGAAMGELQSDSDRPELLLPGDGDDTPDEEDIQSQINRAVGHGWQYEWDGDGSLEDARYKCLDMGVSAVRAYYDPAGGQQKKASDGTPMEAPVGQDGNAITDAAKAHEYVSGLQQAGQQAKFRTVRDGKICWRPGSAFNILAPPGVPHERDFPWEVWVEAVPLDDVQARYPAAKTLAPDADIVSVLGLGMRQSAASTGQDQGPVKLRRYVWLYTCFERATPKFPQGRVCVLAGQGKKLLDQEATLPYQCVDGTWHSGVVYFHWWRLTDRFYSRSLIEALKDPQRLINRRQTQANEIIDRGMPSITVEEGTYKENPSGAPMEVREITKGTTVQPIVNAGIGPGPWMYQDKQELRDDAAHASTLSSLKLGENPENVGTYSQLAILNEQEAGKRAVIRSQHQQAVCKLVELAVYDIQRYWPETKQILVAGGADDQLQAETFSKSKVPTLFVVRPASGTAKPRGQGAQLQLVTDIWNAAVASVAFQSNPLGWVAWYKESLEAGEPLELPIPPVDNQAEIAERENSLLMNGEQPPVAYWDMIQTHLPIHRAGEDQARMAGDIGSLHRIEEHIKEHQAVAAQNAAQLAQVTPQPVIPGSTPVTPGQPNPAPAPPGQIVDPGAPPPEPGAAGPSPAPSAP